MFREEISKVIPTTQTASERCHKEHGGDLSSRNVWRYFRKRVAFKKYNSIVLSITMDKMQRLHEIMHCTDGLWWGCSYITVSLLPFIAEVNKVSYPHISCCKAQLPLFFFISLYFFFISLLINSMYLPSINSKYILQPFLNETL